MSRNEFSKLTKLDAWARAGGNCEICGLTIRGGNGPHYDHVNPDYISGDNTLENCQVLCRTCHGTKTSSVDRPIIDRARRVAEKWINVRSKGSGFRRPAGFKWDWKKSRYVRSE